MKIYVNDELIMELSDTDKAALDNDLLSKKDWIKNAVVGIASKAEKLFRREVLKQIEETEAEAIPANYDKLDTGEGIKIYADDELLLELDPVKTVFLRNRLRSIRENLPWIIQDKIDACKWRMVLAWQPKLFVDPKVETIPTNHDDFVALVVARDDYKNRAAREKDMKNNETTLRNNI